jgi:putative zinc finger/helix-turn-helix YgiT family protein
MGEKCFECGSSLKISKDKSYNYKESGLDNIILVGIKQSYCSKCKETFVTIPKVEVLHRAIGKAICCKKALLDAGEIKFLRKELHLKGKEFARSLGITPETVSRWENNNQTISEGEDRLIRTLYMMFVSEQVDEVVHQDILKLFSSLPLKRKRLTRKPKIKLSPVDWLDEHQLHFCKA